MPRILKSQSQATRRVIAAISAALLTFTLAVVIPTPNAYADEHLTDCGVDVLFVLDRSFSMSQNGGEGEVEDGLDAFIAELDGSASRIGIVDFGTDATIPLSGEWQALDSTDLDDYIGDFEGDSGFTNWEAGMKAANDFTTGVSGEEPDFVIVITDGQPNRFLDSDGEVDNGDADESSDEARAEYLILAPRIDGPDTIMGIGAGDFGDPEIDLLQKIVDPGQVLITSIEDLAATIAAVVEEICTPDDPELSISKSAGSSSVPFDGGWVTYTVELWNDSIDPDSDSLAVTELDDWFNGAGEYDLLTLTVDNADIKANTCDDADPIVLAPGDGVPGEKVTCTFDGWVDDDSVSTTHDSSCDGDGKIDVVTVAATWGDDNTENTQDCADVDVSDEPEPGGTLSIEKQAWDPQLAQFVDVEAFVPAGTVTAQWQITVTNTSEWQVMDLYLTDVNAPACVTAFDIAVAALAPPGTLDGGETVTFTCDSDLPSLPYVNTAQAGGLDIWERPIVEVEDDATVSQVRADGVIGDTVWYDTNDNTVQDGGELGIASVKVTITGLDGQDVDPGTGGVQTTLQQLTNGDGKYLFSGLPAGNYKVQVNIGDVPNNSQNALRFTTASSFTILLTDTGQRLDADFGVIADELPATGINTDTILLVAVLLLIAGTLGVFISRREEGEADTELVA